MLLVISIQKVIQSGLEGFPCPPTIQSSFSRWNSCYLLYLFRRSYSLDWRFPCPPTIQSSFSRWNSCYLLYLFSRSYSLDWRFPCPPTIYSSFSRWNSCYLLYLFSRSYSLDWKGFLVHLPSRVHSLGGIHVTCYIYLEGHIVWTGGFLVHLPSIVHSLGGIHVTCYIYLAGHIVWTGRVSLSTYHLELILQVEFVLLVISIQKVIQSGLEGFPCPPTIQSSFSRWNSCYLLYLFSRSYSLDWKGFLVHLPSRAHSLGGIRVTCYIYLAGHIVWTGRVSLSIYHLEFILQVEFVLLVVSIQQVIQSGLEGFPCPPTIQSSFSRWNSCYLLYLFSRSYNLDWKGFLVHLPSRVHSLGGIRVTCYIYLAGHIVWTGRVSLSTYHLEFILQVEFVLLVISIQQVIQSGLEGFPCPPTIQSSFSRWNSCYLLYLFSRSYSLDWKDFLVHLQSRVHSLGGIRVTCYIYLAGHIVWTGRVSLSIYHLEFILQVEFVLLVISIQQVIQSGLEGFPCPPTIQSSFFRWNSCYLLYLFSRSYSLDWKGFLVHLPSRVHSLGGIRVTCYIYLAGHIVWTGRVSLSTYHLEFILQAEFVLLVISIQQIIQSGLEGFPCPSTIQSSFSRWNSCYLLYLFSRSYSLDWKGFLVHLLSRVHSLGGIRVTCYVYLTGHIVWTGRFSCPPTIQSSFSRWNSCYLLYLFSRSYSLDWKGFLVHLPSRVHSLGGIRVTCCIYLAGHIVWTGRDSLSTYHLEFILQVEFVLLVISIQQVIQSGLEGFPCPPTIQSSFSRRNSCYLLYLFSRSYSLDWKGFLVHLPSRAHSLGGIRVTCYIYLAGHIVWTGRVSLSTYYLEFILQVEFVLLVIYIYQVIQSGLEGFPCPPTIQNSFSRWNSCYLLRLFNRSYSLDWKVFLSTYHLEFILQVEFVLLVISIQQVIQSGLEGFPCPPTIYSSYSRQNSCYLLYLFSR